MKKYLIFLLGLFAVLFIFSSKISADYGCSQYGQYGTCTPSQSILVDKFVGKPDSTSDKGNSNSYEYVDNLGTSDDRFDPGQDIFFMVKIKNTSSVDLNDVKLKDYVPSYLEPLEGPGSYDADSREINFDAGDFGPNEEKIYYFKMRVYAQDSLPSDKGMFCEVNKAEAWNDEASDDDSSQFCIEKQVLGIVTQAPAAGPEMGLLLMAGELVALGTGIFLTKKSTYKN